MKPGWRTFCGGILLGLAVIAAGCGGGGGSDTEVTTSSLDRAAYVKKVNAICTNWTQETIEAMKQKGTEPIATSAPGKAMEQVWAPALREEAEQVRAVGAPSGDEAKVEAYVAALDKAAEEVEVKQPTEILLLEKLLEPVNRPAAAYGLERCEF